jgi:hypothetical protein
MAYLRLPAGESGNKKINLEFKNKKQICRMGLSGI